MNPNDPNNAGQQPQPPQPPQPTQYGQLPQPQQTQPAPLGGSPQPIPTGPATTSRPFQPSSAPQEGANINYDFIMNPAQPAAKSGAGENKALKMLLLVGGACAVLIVVLFVLVSVFSPSTSSAGLVGIVQRQQEIIRLAALGQRESESESLKSLSYAIDLTVGTNQNSAVAYLTENDSVIPKEELGAKREAETDSQLETAKTTSTYDSALRELFIEQLTAYTSELQTAYKNTESDKQKTILNDSFTTAQALLNQAKALAGS